ncbi:hypothetical protein FSARC_9429 [Fusarium sarcochroum]|uniref:Uncharacterized protein n=1 Tax=Fusarium sarcochroum TaxID=1208366 RepID=A0A8H4X694_9HYPO|nr:hypothetical protein FSARC_9429 [Fusarium sarcochroum]
MDMGHDDTAPARKKMRLQSPEPDYDGDVESPTWHQLESAFELACDNASWSDIFMASEESNLATGFDNQPGLTAVETVPHVCLGVIILNATSSFFKSRNNTQADVNLRQCGDFLKLYASDEGKYAGIATEPTLSGLLTKDPVKLSALLIAPTSLRVIVLSTMGETVEVGNILSKGSLFLQHPSPRDIEHFELEMEYFNPHYLVSPGSRMPQLEDLAIDYDDSPSNSNSVLDERGKGQLMSIFDTAGNLSVQPTTEPSPRLQTHLKE